MLLCLERGGDFVSNAQLRGRKIERADDGIAVPFRTGMDHTTQASPHHHVPARNDLSTGVYVTHNDDMPCELNSGSRTKGAMEEQRRLFTQIFYRKFPALFRSRLGDAGGQTK